MIKRLLDPQPLPIRHLPPFGQGVYIAALLVFDAARLRILTGRR